MNTSKLSPDVLSCHERAARSLAASYLDALQRDYDNTLTTLADLASTFRHHLSQRVFSAAEARGIRRISVRRDLIVSLAHAEVLAALRKEAVLAGKLVAIRAAQAAR
jgi:hypothetical protein